MDLWIFNIDLSYACLRLEALIERIDVDVWIFENQGSGYKTPWFFGVLYSDIQYIYISVKCCGFFDF